MDLMVKGDVVEESSLVPLPDGHCGPAEDAGHCVWLSVVVYILVMINVFSSREMYLFNSNTLMKSLL